MAPNYSDEDDDDDIEDDDVEEEEEEVVAPPPVAKKRRTKSGKFKDPNKPKRNMSAFFLYSQAFRSQVKTDHPEAPFGDIVSHHMPFSSFQSFLMVFREFEWHWNDISSFGGYVVVTVLTVFTL